MHVHPSVWLVARSLKDLERSIHRIAQQLGCLTQAEGGRMRRQTGREPPERPVLEQAPGPEPGHEADGHSREREGDNPCQHLRRTRARCRVPDQYA